MVISYHTVVFTARQVCYLQ